MNRVIKILLSTIVFLCGTTSSVHGETNPGSLIRFKPQEINKDFEDLGITRKDAFQIDFQTYVLSGADDRQDENDYGIRLFVIKGGNLIFRSKGMMDSWYLNLTFFRSEEDNNKVLMLAESGDEAGSYGCAVYELKNSRVKRIGYIDASVLDDSAEYLLSAAPFVEIAETSDGYVFTFTKDVFVQDENTNKYKTISRQSIKYVYDGKEDIKKIIE